MSGPGHLRPFEVGPIRPPSEATSLLVRVTRNCPWNRCAFCPVYKGQRFGLREVEEIKADIRAMAELARRLNELSWQMGEGGCVSRAVLAAAPPEVRTAEAVQVALFLNAGGQTAFLQDANTVIMPVGQLAEVLGCLRECFPAITRVTSYARSHTLTKRSVADLERLRGAGLDRIHVGLESGSDSVLRMVDKGVGAARHIDAGLRVKAAGIELSEYVMPGLGGRALSEEHATETARVLREIDPHFVRLRTLAIPPGSPLAELRRRGEFQPLDDLGVVRELRLLLCGMSEMSGTILSDHVLNLLEEVEGRLPADLPRMLAAVDRFLDLEPQEQEVFVLGRRLGLLRRLDDLDDPHLSAAARGALAELRRRLPGPVERAVGEIMTRFL